MMIEHAHSECTGTWHLRSGEIRCDSCRRTYPASPSYRMAAIDENTLGDLLRLGARQGTSLLSDEDG
jgi:hypothetical protein